MSLTQAPGKDLRKILIDFCPLYPHLVSPLLVPYLTNSSCSSSPEPWCLLPQLNLPPRLCTVVGTVPRQRGRRKCGVIMGFSSCFFSKEHGPSLHIVLFLKELLFILLTFKVVYRKRASLVPVTLPQLEVQVQSFYWVLKERVILEKQENCGTSYGIRTAALSWDVVKNISSGAREAIIWILPSTGRISRKTSHLTSLFFSFLHL